MRPPLPTINILCKSLAPYQRVVINAPPGQSINQRGEDGSDQKLDLKRKFSRPPLGLCWRRIPLQLASADFWKFLKERKR